MFFFFLALSRLIIPFWNIFLITWRIHVTRTSVSFDKYGIRVPCTF